MRLLVRASLGDDPDEIRRTLTGLADEIAGTVSFGVRYVLTYRFSQRLWRVNYDWAPTVRMGGAAIVLVLISGRVPQLPLPGSIALHAAMMLFYLIFLWTAGPLSSELKGSVVTRARQLVSRSGATLS